MALSKFSVDVTTLEGSTRQVIQPNHITQVQEEEEVLEAGVDTQLLHIPPAPRDEEEEQGGDAQENSFVLKCIMEDARDHLHEFREFEHYFIRADAGSDSDVPEDELTDEMEDISCDEDPLVPAGLQEKEGPTEEDHGLPSPGIIPVEKLSSGEDHLIPVKFQVEENPIKGDHDQPSRPGNIQLEDITTIQGNQTGPLNLHITLVNVQVTEPEDPNTSTRLDFNITTFDSVYREAGQEVKVETVTTTSAAEGESSSSRQILMDTHVDPKPPESKDSYELLHETVNGDSFTSS